MAATLRNMLKAVMSALIHVIQKTILLIETLKNNLRFVLNLHETQGSIVQSPISTNPGLTP